MTMRRWIQLPVSIFLSMLIFLMILGTLHANPAPPSETDVLIGEMDTSRAPYHPNPPAEGVTYDGNRVAISAPAKNPAAFLWNAGQIAVPGKAKIELEAEVRNGTISTFLLKYGGEALPAPDRFVQNGERVTATWYVNERDNFILSVLGIQGTRSGDAPAEITVHSLKVWQTAERIVGEMNTSTNPWHPSVPPEGVMYDGNTITVSDPARTTPNFLWNAGQIRVPSDSRIILDATIMNGNLPTILLQKFGGAVMWPTDVIRDGDSIRAVWDVDGEESFILSVLGIAVSRTGDDSAVLTVNSLRVWEPLKDEPLKPNALDADTILQTPPVHEAKIREHNGAMTLFLDDEPITGQLWSSLVPANLNDQYIREVVGGLDYPIAAITFAVGENTLNRLFPTTWLDDDVYDWTSVDQQAKRVLAAKPDVKLILNLAFDGAVWWTDKNSEAHNDEVDDNQNSKGVPDYLHPTWKETAREVLRQLVAHVQSSDWGHAVIGYELFNGSSMDTNFRIPHGNDRVIADFRDFLIDKYGSDVKLQEAWNDPDVTLETALPEIEHMPTGIILQPAEHQRFLDTRELLLGQFREVFSHFAAVIKEATQGRALVGARTGDFVGSFAWDASWFKVGEDSGWLMPLLQDPNFDYFDVQEPYVGRQLADGANVPVIPPKAVTMYGKAVLIQNDVRTYLSNPGIGYGRTPDLETTIHKQRHVFANALTNDTIPYLYQLDYRYNNEDLLAEYRRQEAVYRNALDRDRSSVAEVAFVFDPEMRLYLGKDNLYTAPTRYFALFDTAKHMWQRAGVPFDMIFLDQIEEFDPYKVYIFFNTWKYSEEQLEMIRNKVLTNGQTAVFHWADGVLSNNRSYESDTISELTGLDIKLSNEERTWSMLATEELAALTSIEEGTEVGLLPRANMDPDPSIADAGHFVFGPSYTIQVDEGSGIVPLAKRDGEVTAAMAEREDYTVIYTASGNLTLPLYKLALEKADVFQYTDSSAIFMMNQSYVGVHASQSEMLRLQLQTPEILIDLFNGMVYPASDVHEIPVERGETYLFARTQFLTKNMMTLIEELEHSEQIKHASAARALTVHVTAVNLYERQGEFAKVVEHMERFKWLLNHQHDHEMISESAFEDLMELTDAIIEQWENVIPILMH